MAPNERVALYGKHGELAYAKLAANVAREFARALDQERKSNPKLTRAEIAKRLNVDKSYVTRALSGTGNLTVRSIAAVFAALGYEAELIAHRIDAIPGTKTNSYPMSQDGAQIERLANGSSS